MKSFHRPFGSRQTASRSERWYDAIDLRDRCVLASETAAIVSVSCKYWMGPERCDCRDIPPTLHNVCRPCSWLYKEPSSSHARDGLFDLLAVMNTSIETEATSERAKKMCNQMWLAARHFVKVDIRMRETVCLRLAAPLRPEVGGDWKGISNYFLSIEIYQKVIFFLSFITRHQFLCHILWCALLGALQFSSHCCDLCHTY